MNETPVVHHQPPQRARRRHPLRKCCTPHIEHKGSERTDIALDVDGWPVQQVGQPGFDLS
jgi:hypothetical protein